MNTLSKKIMRRVWAIYALRQFVSPWAVKIYAIFALGWLVKLDVSIVDVLDNAGSAGSVTYFWYALTHTTALVQAAVFAVAALALWFTRDILRNLRQPSASRHSYN